MTHPYWLISTRSDGVQQRCHFDGHDWLVRMRAPDGREVASASPMLMDAADRCALMLGVPRNHELPPDTPMTRGEPILDPVAALDRAIHERNEALGNALRRLVPAREWVLAGAALAIFAVVAWVHAK